MALIPDLHQFLYLGVLPLGVVAGLEVLGEELCDDLPEIGGETALVFLDDFEGAHTALPVYQAHKQHALGGGHLLDVAREDAEQLLFHLLDVLGALGALGRVGSYSAVHLGYHFPPHEGIGINLVEIIHQAVFLAPVALPHTAAAGEHPDRLDGIEEGRIPVVRLIIHREALGHAVAPASRAAAVRSLGKRCRKAR